MSTIYIMHTLLVCFRDNFLQVDIFYKQLRYERVIQRPSFEMLSLLSDIGGFLGLLLGASVLTVVELLDYLILSAAAACNNRQRDKLQKQTAENKLKVVGTSQDQNQIDGTGNGDDYCKSSEIDVDLAI